MIAGVLFLCSFSLLQARYLPVPPSVGSKAVYHVFAHQIDNWSCGYNTLFNAANLEQAFGFKNAYSDFKKFQQLCTSFIRQRRKRREDGVSNSEIQGLAINLGLQRSQYLAIKDTGEIAPLLESPTVIEARPDLPKHQVEQLFKQARIKREEALIADLKKELAKKKVGFIHFICHVFAKKGEDHGILASLVQKDTGVRALYLFDNLNMPIKETSVAKRYIDFICTNFQVSPQEVYSPYKVTIPNKWPTTPVLPPGYYYQY